MMIVQQHFVETSRKANAITAANMMDVHNMNKITFPLLIQTGAVGGSSDERKW
jgi:hypothetical protein